MNYQLYYSLIRDMKLIKKHVISKDPQIDNPVPPRQGKVLNYTLLLLAGCPQICVSPSGHKISYYKFNTQRKS